MVAIGARFWFPACEEKKVVSKIFVYYQINNHIHHLNHSSVSIMNALKPNFLNLEIILLPFKKEGVWEYIGRFFGK